MQQPKNYLGDTVRGTLLVIISLFILYVIPEFDIGNFHFKRINLLADVIKRGNKSKLAVDSAKMVKQVFADTCKPGITCVEDYTADTSGLKTFLSALEGSKQKLVRIAWFGDSYVEGDIMLDPLRDSLQAIFGGSGVGFVPVTSEVAGFRETVRHSYEHWKTYSMVGDMDDEHPLGFSGYCFIPKKGNNVSYKPIRRKRLNEFPSVKIFYGNADEGILLANEDTLPVDESKRLKMIAVNKPLEALDISVPYEDKVDLYGVSFESKTGVEVDNFSMRGNSGIGLAYVKEEMYRDLDSLHHYDLVVLSYGLNVASQKAKNYEWYTRGMKKVIPMIKRAFPHSSILLVGCSDRAEKINGEYQTMPMLKELVEVQRQMAADGHICFWDLFEAMGGDSTMVNWANMEPHALANKDYTHLTFRGGKKVADIFLGTILYEREKYVRKRKS